MAPATGGTWMPRSVMRAVMRSRSRRPTSSRFAGGSRRRRGLLGDVGQLHDAEHGRSLAEPAAAAGVASSAKRSSSTSRTVGSSVEPTRTSTIARAQPRVLLLDDLDGAVRHDAERAVVLAQRGDPQRQRLDRAAHGAALGLQVDDVADVELALERDEEPGERVPHERLRAEAERDADDAGAREQRAERHPERREHVEANQDPDDHLQGRRHQAGDRRDAPAPRAFHGVVGRVLRAAVRTAHPGAEEQRDHEREEQRQAELDPQVAPPLRGVAGGAPAACASMRHRPHPIEGVGHRRQRQPCETPSLESASKKAR